MSGPISDKLEEFRALATTIAQRHADEITQFYTALAEFTSTPEFHAYGVEHSMSYQATNPLLDITCMLSPQGYFHQSADFWIPSSWESC